MLPQRPTLALRGAVGDRSVTVPIAVTPAGERTDVLAGLWARARVDELELTRTTTEDPRARDDAARQILATGLEHHLVTAFTSLVAVDTSRKVTPGRTIVHASPDPRTTCSPRLPKYLRKAFSTPAYTCWSFMPVLLANSRPAFFSDSPTSFDCCRKKWLVM